MNNQAAQTMPEPVTASMCPSSDYAKGWNDCLAAMLAAAPAASGVHPDALPDGTLSKSTAKRVTALAAVSVSERARGYRQHDAIEFAVRDLGYSPAEAARITAAIEQALTQQRGAEWSDDLRAVLDAASEASQVPLMWLANQDFSPEQTRAWLCEAVDATVEEGAFSGSLHQIAEEGTGHVVAFTGCGPKSAANAKFLIWCVHFILKHRDALATTPQPSADAVREYVTELRAQADQKMGVAGACAHDGDRARYKSAAQLLRRVADELESLLSAASGEKGVGK